MKVKPALAITLVALKTQKTRTFLASLGIMIGVAAVIIMVAIGRGSEQEVMDVVAGMGENLITINAGEMKRRGGRLKLSGNVTTLTSRDANKLLDEVDELEKVAPFESRSMKVKFGSFAAETQVSGSTQDYQEIRKYEVAQGEFFTEMDLKLSRRVAVIGKTTVDNIFGEEDPLGRTLRINSVPFEVIGVFTPKGVDTDGRDQDDIILIPLTTMLRRLINQTFISTIYAKAVSKREINPAIEKIRIALRERHKLRGVSNDDFTIISQLDIEELKRETTELFTKLIVSIAAISLVVGGIGILAVMLISVKERTREIGIRRAVGATKVDITQQFLLESLVIGILGGGVGVAFGVGITLAASHWGPWVLVLDSQAILMASGVCMGIAVLFGIFPAIKASRLDPMVALTVE
jgi:putative ABC transport system permease protein